MYQKKYADAGILQCYSTQLQADDMIESRTSLVLENDLKTECLCVQGWAGSIDIKCTWHAQLTLQTLQMIG
jgi:hypothetical protein